jgi:hypothetical protein
LTAAQLKTKFDTTIPSDLLTVERGLDRVGTPFAVFLLLIFSAWAWVASREARLSFDELLEISVATAPTVHQIVPFLAAGIDYNPPLSHVLTRLSIATFPNSEVAARLPAFLGFVVLLVFLYGFVTRWLSPSYGIFAMLLIMSSPVRMFAVFGRPYGLVLGFAGAALFAYQRAITHKPRAIALMTLSLCSAALAASHYYGILATSGILFAELLRAKTLKRPDWKPLTCTIVPAALVFALLLDTIRHQRSQFTNYFARGNLLSFDHGYDAFDIDPMIYCVGLLLVIATLWRLRTLNPSGVKLSLDAFSPEVCAGFGLLLLPILGAFLTQFVTHAYISRYFLPAVMGLAICLCYVIRLSSVILPGIIVLLNIALAVGFGKTTMQDFRRPPEMLPARVTLAAANGPILFDAPSAYVQVRHYYPELRSKLWVIADPSTQLRYRNYDTDDKIMLALATKGLAQTITLRDAVRRWPTFSLIPRSADYVWALKCLMDVGAKITTRAAFGNSNFVFDVTVLPENLPAIDACGNRVQSP